MYNCFVNCLIIFGFIFSQSVENTELKNLNARTLMVVTIFQEPFMMLKKDGQKIINETSILPGTIIDPSLVEGYCADLAQVICHDKLKLPYKFLIETKYGKEMEKGVWNGIIGTLANRTADLSVAPLVITEAREKVVDFSKPFIDVGISIMIRKPKQQSPGFFSLISSHSIEIGLFAIILYLFIRIFLFLLSQFSSYLCRFETKNNSVERNELSMQDTLFLSLSVFLHRNAKTLPKPLSGRITKCAWFGFCILIILIVGTSLVVFLRFDKAPIHIETVEDLAKQTEIHYGAIRNGSIMNFFKTSTLKVFKDMWNFMEQHKDEVLVASNAEGIEKVRQSKGKYAFLMESAFNDYANGRLPCDTMRLGENLDTNGYGIATSLGSNLREAIGKGVSELKQNGYLALLKRKWYHERSECGNSATKDTKQKIIPNLVYCATMLYILIIIIIMVITISVFEFLIKLKMCPNQSNQDTGRSAS